MRVLLIMYICVERSAMELSGMELVGNCHGIVSKFLGIVMEFLRNCDGVVGELLSNSTDRRGISIEFPCNVYRIFV